MSVPVTPEPAATDQRLIEACRKAYKQWHRGADLPELPDFIAEALASRVVWRDNLTETDECRNCGVTWRERRGHPGTCANCWHGPRVRVFRRLVGE